MMAPARQRGIYDLRFAVYDAQANGNLDGGPLTNSITPVTNGLFTALLADLRFQPARTIQAIELQKLRLSEKLALRIAYQSGISVGWLLGNNVEEQPPVGNAATRTGRPHEIFDHTRGAFCLTTP